MAAHVAAAVTFGNPSGHGDAPRITGFDLAGQEKDNDPILFQELFMPLHHHFMNITIHAGEMEEDDKIWQAIYLLHARRIGLATATIAALGTLAIAIAAAGTMGGTPSTAAAVDAATIISATAAAATPAPTEQVVVDTVYVNAPAPKALPPIVVPSKVKATPKPPIRVVKIVPSAGGGEREGGDQGEAQSGEGDD